MTIRYLSLFSGIEAASLAWADLGWEPVAFAEIEKFPSAVLDHRWPGVPNLGDITRLTREDIKALGPIDLVVGGFPCQDLSVAGKRKGLSNVDGTLTRSGLFYVAKQIVEWANPRWLVLENVPGLFSSNRGRDFQSVLESLSGLDLDVQSITHGRGELARIKWQGAGAIASSRGLFEWRTLDAQFLRTPQRRRRVFIVADFGDWTRRSPILLEPEGLYRDLAPGSQAQPQPALAAEDGAGGGGETAPVTGVHAFGGGNCSGALEVSTCLTHHGNRQDFDTETFLVDTEEPVPQFNTAPCLRAGNPYNNSDATMEAQMVLPVVHREAKEAGDIIAFSCKDDGRDAVNNLCPTLRAMNSCNGRPNGGGQLAIAYDEDAPPQAFAENQRAEVRTMKVMGALNTGGGKPGQGYPAVLTDETPLLTPPAHPAPPTSR